MRIIAIITSIATVTGCSSSPRPAGDDDDVPDAGSGTADSGEDPAPATEDCTRYPYRAETLYAERLGFGRNTTGGDWAMPYHVTTLADAGPGSLREALESPNPYWIVFDVEGVIDLGEAVHPLSNKTVDGRGRDITIDGNLKLDAGTRNMIFSDVKLQYVEGWEAQDGDIISIRGNGHDDPEQYDSRDMWFHHLELGRGGDGQLDNRGATYVTISWTHLHSHNKAMLHTNDTEQLPSRGNRTTYHHNFFDRVSRRGPQFHWGLGDFFNNYQYQWYEYGAAPQQGAKFLSQSNIYEARPGEYCYCPDPNNPAGDMDIEVSKVALTPQWDTEPGYIKSVGDVTREGAVITQREPQLVFDRAAHYDAVVDPADDALVEALKTKTGPRRDYCGD